MKCGEICFKCTEPCQYKCEHSECTRLCYEICDRDPCPHPCLKKLDCGHDCISFCSEKCPTICRVEGCKNYKAEHFEIYFGNEGNPDARFIELEDCGHLIESNSLE